jgi:hypothetical protein
MRKIILTVMVFLLTFTCYLVLAEEQTRLPSQNEIHIYINSLISNYNSKMNYLLLYNPNLFKIDDIHFLLYVETGQSFEVICVKGDKNSNDSVCFIFLKKIISNESNIQIRFDKQLSDFTSVTMSGEKVVVRNVLYENVSVYFYAPLIILESSQDIINDPNGSSNYWAETLLSHDIIDSIWSPYKIQYRDIISNNSNLSNMQRNIDIKIASNDFSYNFAVFLQEFQEFNSTIQNQLDEEKNIQEVKILNERYIQNWYNAIFLAIIIFCCISIIFYTMDNKVNEKKIGKILITSIDVILMIVFGVFSNAILSFDYPQISLIILSIILSSIFYFVIIEKIIMKKSS